MQIPATRRGQILLQRQILPARDGLLALTQTFAGSDTRTLVTHGAFVVTRIEVREGSLSFPLYSGSVEAPHSFLLAVPPRSLVPMTFDTAHVVSQGVAGFAHSTITVPTILECAGENTLLDMEAVRRAFAAPVLKDFDPDESVTPVVVRARKLLHDLIAHPAPLRTASRRVGIRSETLCRAFSRAYRLTPKQYCHRARMFEAVLRMMAGATIIEAAFDAGFQDLKRFYVQFRRLLGTTPQPYQVKKRQDSCSKKLL